MKDNVYLQYVVEYQFSNTVVKKFKKVGIDTLNIFKPCFWCNLDPFLLNQIALFFQLFFLYFAEGCVC